MIVIIIIVPSPLILVAYWDSGALHPTPNALSLLSLHTYTLARARTHANTHTHTLGVPFLFSPTTRMCHETLMKTCIITAEMFLCPNKYTLRSTRKHWPHPPTVVADTRRTLSTISSFLSTFLSFLSSFFLVLFSPCFSLSHSLSLSLSHTYGLQSTLNAYSIGPSTLIFVFHRFFLFSAFLLYTVLCGTRYARDDILGPILARHWITDLGSMKENALWRLQNEKLSDFEKVRMQVSWDSLASFWFCLQFTSMIFKDKRPKRSSTFSSRLLYHELVRNEEKFHRK